MAWVFDRSEATGCKIYVDGAEVSYDAQPDQSAESAVSLANARPFGVGANGDGSGSKKAFKTAQMRVWKFGINALPADYEKAIIELAANPFELSNILTASDCKGWWKLDCDYTDDSGNSNDLTEGGSGNTFELQYADRS